MKIFVVEFYIIIIVIIIICIIFIISSCHRLFFLAIALNQRWFPPLRLQTSRCSTFRTMYDIPSIAVFF